MGTLAPAPLGNQLARKLTPELKAAFVEELRKIKFIRRAARAVGISPTAIYENCKTDPEFAADVDEVRLDRNEDLEFSAYQRAHVGVKRPIVQGGKVVKEKVEVRPGVFEERPVVITEFSDDLLKFTMQACMPEKYRNKITVDANVTQTGVLIVATALDAQQAEEQLARLEAARRRGEAIDIDSDLPPVGEVNA